MSIERELLKRFMTELNTEEDVVSLFNDIKECLAQPEQSEQEPVTDKPTETAMAVMHNGVCVSNVYDAYEEGRKSLMSEQEPVAWIDDGSLKSLQESTGYALRFLTNDTESLKNTDVPLYLAPQKREPLSDEEIDKGYQESDGNYYDLAFRDGVRFAEKHNGVGVDDEN